MSMTRFEVSLFDSKTNFGSWKKKMRVLLSHHKVSISLEADASKWTIYQEHVINEEAYNLLFLHIADVICKVDGMNTPP